MNHKIENQNIHFISEYKTEIEVLQKHERLIKNYGKLPPRIKEAFETKLKQLHGEFIDSPPSLH